MSKTLFIALVLFFLLVAGVFFAVQRSGSPPQKDDDSNIRIIPKAQREVVLTNYSFVLVRYTPAGYVPANVRIKKGTTVIFENNDSSNMWPASADHSTHALYPTMGGCVGSTFDACRALKPREEWTFIFDAVGTWKYHDHLNPQHIGSIKVE